MTLEEPRLTPRTYNRNTYTPIDPISLALVQQIPPSTYQYPGCDYFGCDWYTTGFDVERSHGLVVAKSAVIANDGANRNDTRIDLYCVVCEEAPNGEFNSNCQWKRVDLFGPRIDPRTGQPWDPFLEWYSPLAK